MPVVLAYCFFLFLLEKIFPIRKMPFFRKYFLSDFAWYVIIQEQLLQLLLIRYLIQLSHAHHFNLIEKWPLWLQCIVVFILFDFATYWLHRFLHHSNLMWRFHELHHSSTQLDWLAGARNHYVDSILAAAVNVSIFCLLGGQFVVAQVVLIVVTVHGLYKHSNIRNKPGWLQYFIISSEMHHIHHRNEEKFQKANYGTVLSVWDWMFGSVVYPQNTENATPVYGTDGQFPESFWKGNLHVFRKKKGAAPASLQQIEAIKEPAGKTENIKNNGALAAAMVVN